MGVMRQLSLVKANTSHKVMVNVPFLAVKGATSRTYLPPRDDTAEYDDSGPDLTGVEDEVVTGFALRFEYTNTLTSLEQKEVARYDITVPVYVILVALYLLYILSVLLELN